MSNRYRMFKKGQPVYWVRPRYMRARKGSRRDDYVIRRVTILKRMDGRGAYYWLKEFDKPVAASMLHAVLTDAKAALAERNEPVV